MGWTFDQSTPVYIQIEQRIRSDILRGVYPADTQLPSVRQLAMEAAVNPNTVQRALTELENSGIVYVKGTVGRFVTGDAGILYTEHRRMKQKVIDDFLDSAEQLGISRSEIIEYLKQGE